MYKNVFMIITITEIKLINVYFIQHHTRIFILYVVNMLLDTKLCTLLNTI